MCSRLDLLVFFFNALYLKVAGKKHPKQKENIFEHHHNMHLVQTSPNLARCPSWEMKNEKVLAVIPRHSPTTIPIFQANNTSRLRTVHIGTATTLRTKSSQWP